MGRRVTALASSPNTSTVSSASSSASLLRAGTKARGIGLAIVRKAAEKMGGAVGVESDGLTGSRFWIQLPAA